MYEDAGVQGIADNRGTKGRYSFCPAVTDYLLCRYVVPAHLLPGHFIRAWLAGAKRRGIGQAAASKKRRKNVAAAEDGAGARRLEQRHDGLSASLSDSCIRRSEGRNGGCGNHGVEDYIRVEMERMNQRGRQASAYIITL